MRDRRADLRLDVVADDRDAGLLEAALPVGLARDEDRHAVDHRAARLEDLLGVPLRRRLGADREVVDDDVDARVSLRIPTTSSVSPGAFSTTSERYLPIPSWVIPRETVIPVFGTSANLIVSFGCAQIASARSSPTLPSMTSNAADELDVADVVAAEVDVHQARDELSSGASL